MATVEAVGIGTGETVGERELLARAIDFVAAAVAELPGIATALRRGDRAAALTALADVLRGTGPLVQFALRLDPSGGPRPDFAALQAVLTEIVRAQEQQDYVTLASTVEQPLAHVLVGWSQSFAARTPAGDARP